MTHDLTNGWYITLNGTKGKDESAVVANANNGETIALGTESLTKLREILKEAGK